jgi:hypothetical protein
MKRGVSTKNSEIQRIFNEYFDSLYCNKLENTEEMDKFLDAYNLLKLNQWYINHLNRSVINNEIKA